MHLILCLLLAAAGTRELTPQEMRGQKIYRSGERGSDVPITALVGAENIEVPGSVVPCASCHGRDGRGKEEGGLRPSNLQWDALTKPYGMVTSTGRKHPPYTRTLLRRAITMGLDSAKNRLHAAMPRYRMSLRDADDLIAYLTRLGDDADPGLSEDSIRIGVILPPARGEGDERSAVRETVDAYFERVNRDGGIFGRRVDVRFGESTNVEAFIDGEQPFAITAAYIVGREEEIGSVLAKKGVPSIAAFSTRGDIANRYLFHLLARVEEQSLALIDAVPGEGQVRIVYDAHSAEIASRIARHLGRRIVDASDAPVVLFLGDRQSLAKLLASGTTSTIVLPAQFTSDAIFSAPPATRLLVALPASVSDETPPGTAELRSLVPSLTHRTTRATALAAAKLLERALERAGRDIDRESLVDTLDKFRRESSDLILPVTWTAGRHVGTSDCTILRVDLQTKSLVPLEGRK